MSVYIPTVWKNNVQPSINATNLNHLETEGLISGATPAGKSSTAILAYTVDPATRTSLGGARIWVDTTDTAKPVGYIET